MNYLIIGVDRHTLSPWHQNIRARDVKAAKRMALARADALGINLVMVAVIGPSSSIL